MALVKASNWCVLGFLTLLIFVSNFVQLIKALVERKNCFKISNFTWSNLKLNVFLDHDIPLLGLIQDPWTWLDVNPKVTRLSPLLGLDILPSATGLACKFIKIRREVVGICSKKALWVWLKRLLELSVYHIENLRIGCPWRRGYIKSLKIGSRYTKAQVL